jgi:hypothetical protein
VVYEMDPSSGVSLGGDGDLLLVIAVDEVVSVAGDGGEPAAGEDVRAEVAAAFDSLAVLLGEDGAARPMMASRSGKNLRDGEQVDLQTLRAGSAPPCVTLMAVAASSGQLQRR